jgi:hypothetical protein
MPSTVVMRGLATTQKCSMCLRADSPGSEVPARTTHRLTRVEKGPKRYHLDPDIVLIRKLLGTCNQKNISPCTAPRSSGEDIQDHRMSDIDLDHAHTRSSTGTRPQDHTLRQDQAQAQDLPQARLCAARQSSVTVPLVLPVATIEGTCASIKV